MSSMLSADASLAPDRHGGLARADEWWADDGVHGETRRDAPMRLLDRLGWDEAITRADAARAEIPTTASVIVLQADRLRPANDTCGDELGDELLRTVAIRVCGALREGDLVARIGGDQLAVLLPGADESACEKVVTRLRDALCSGSLDRFGFPISVAVGFATASGPDTLTRAQRWADARMFTYKMLAVDAKPGELIGAGFNGIFTVEPG